MWTQAIWFGSKRGDHDNLHPFLVPDIASQCWALPGVLDQHHAWAVFANPFPNGRATFAEHRPLVPLIEQEVPPFMNRLRLDDAEAVGWAPLLAWVDAQHYRQVLRKRLW
jgi:hypothetical protein